MGDGLDVDHRDVLAVEKGGDAAQHRDRRVGRSGELLVHRDAAAPFVEQGEVGERSADVHSKAPAASTKGLLSTCCGRLRHGLGRAHPGHVPRAARRRARVSDVAATSTLLPSVASTTP